ncbi:Trk system potassium uptake protein TrkG [Chlamydiales bacterium STE3]|nr:Trk system potassium uptake protein TrkG [Chlamydiales bacterium STE3]
MLYKSISRIVGFYLLIFAVVLLIPFCLALYYQLLNDPVSHPQHYTADDFFYTLLIALSLGGVCVYIGRNASGNIYRKEGLAAVVLIWLLTPAISAIPFLTSGTLDSFWQAYFEMASGYTTTGSTILHAKKFNAQGEEIPIERIIEGVRDTKYLFYGTVSPVRDPTTGEVVKEGIEAVERTLLFWRSFTQWLGGGGIVVLFVAILPLLGVGGKVLFQSEVSGPSKGSITPRIKETALQLWQIYIFLTLAQIFMLAVMEPTLPLFDNVTIAFSTISTGGFSVRNTSLAAYQSVAVEWVVLFFMIVGSVNFTLYYYIVRGKLFKLYETEFVLFIFLMGFLAIFVSWLIIDSQMVMLTGIMDGVFSLGPSLRYGVFQLVSAMSSTGFSTIDYDVWPFTAQSLLWIAMFFGGMSGSTAGGIKTIRLYMLFRIAQYKVESLFRPENVRLFQIGNWEVDSSRAATVLTFFLVIAAASVFGTLVYIFDGVDMETSIGLVACMVNNTGLSFRMAGPQFSCAFLSDFDLFISSFLMILGRLEYYSLLAVLVPAFWRKDS